MCLWTVLVMCLVCPLLFVSLDCLSHVSCMANVVYVSGLSYSCVLYGQCCLCLWIVLVLCLVWPMLSVFLDCLSPMSCMANVACVSGLS
jgi:hypothetical protein